jgi:UDP-N-acetylmuramoylalanine--D-glutamate ligase
VTELATLTDAVRGAAQACPSGGHVLLSPACASFDQFANFAARGEAYRAAVLDLPAPSASRAS